MKKIIVLILLFVPVFCFAQNKIALSHFWDIPWGTTIDSAEEIFRERGFNTIREGRSLAAQAQYEGEDAVIVLLFNRVNRFFSGNVVYLGNPNNVISKYQNYRRVLFRRYGMPDTAVELFVEPFEKGDGREVEAIRTDNAFFFTEWEFGNGCFASVSIQSSLEVWLTFRSPVFTDLEIGSR